MAYGKIKADTLVYDNSGSDVETSISSLAAKASSPASAGTVGASEVVQVDANKDTTGIRNLTISGNLQVNGTTTTVASSTMTVTDKNIEIAKGAANDAAADGAGITIDSGDGDKTWNWVDATDAWTSSEHIHLGDNKKLLVGTGSDLEIYHDGTYSYLKNNTSQLRVQSATFGVQKTDGSEAIIWGDADGSVALYHDGVQKISTSAAGVTVTGSVTDSKGDLRSIPQVSVTSAYDVVPATAGRHIFTTANVKLANNMTAGDAITIVNNHSGDITIDAATNSVTLTNSADAATGNRTLASKGMATVLYVGSSTCFISGAGLS